ncbi:MAG: hypothetical protein WCY98_05320 [Castellaniella sp.]
MKLRALMWILWPSFLAAGLTSAIVFALIDPQDLFILDRFHPSRNGAYALGFFLFWFMATVSSTLSILMAPRHPELDEFGEPLR